MWRPGKFDHDVAPTAPAEIFRTGLIETLYFDRNGDKVGESKGYESGLAEADSRPIRKTEKTSELSNPTKQTPTYKHTITINLLTNSPTHL
jgi:hypothetical protein